MCRGEFPENGTQPIEYLDGVDTTGTFDLTVNNGNNNYDPHVDPHVDPYVDPYIADSGDGAVAPDVVGSGDAPVVLDLTGNGINITQLTSSNTFFDMTGDGYKNLTAWAGAGNGVLFVDATGAGQLTQANQVIFTKWDPGATSDMQALLDVFDTNHDGALDAGDADFSKFFVMVDQRRRHTDRPFAGGSRNHVDRSQRRRDEYRACRRFVDRRRDHVHDDQPVDRRDHDERAATVTLAVDPSGYAGRHDDDGECGRLGDDRQCGAAMPTAASPMSASSIPVADGGIRRR